MNDVHSEPVGQRETKVHPEDSRREFLRGSSLLLAGAMPVGFHLGEHADPAPESLANPRLRVGLIGGGRRGMRLCEQLLSNSPNAVVTAVADAFSDRLQQAVRTLNGRFRSQLEIVESTRFVGLDAYQRLLNSDVDLVLLATCPAFRPCHIEAAIASGKNIVAARPLAIDVPGMKRVDTALSVAQQQSTRFEVALDHRANPRYFSTIEQLQQGAIGDIVFLRAYSQSWPGRLMQRFKGQSELEFQLRSWQHFDWTSGGGMLEEQADYLDICNWLMRAVPIEAQGVFGRQTSDATGEQAMEHLSVEYRYASGTRLQSVWRRASESWSGPALSAHGTRGWCDLAGGKIYDRDKSLIWKASGRAETNSSSERNVLGNGQGDDPKPPLSRPNALWSEASIAAEATMTAILGREAAISGKRMSMQECLLKGGGFSGVDRLRDLREAFPA